MVTVALRVPLLLEMDSKDITLITLTTDSYKGKSRYLGAGRVLSHLLVSSFCSFYSFNISDAPFQYLNSISFDE
ncbi:hypothetical protein J1N35_035379 [Gossypium stocksii]|uniref:Uncharacterized protein n=1 Tax=Gossypium stocksii TaxID=47602 RepID=A0A9D3UUP0_9ROSI|nr:hypothetical protein J1N35_035379 [Gossypium stocksii]